VDYNDQQNKDHYADANEETSSKKIVVILGIMLIAMLIDPRREDYPVADVVSLALRVLRRMVWPAGGTPVVVGGVNGVRYTRTCDAVHCVVVDAVVMSSVVHGRRAYSDSHFVF